MDGSTIANALAGGIQLNYVSGTGSSFTSLCTDIAGTLYLGYNYSYAAPTGFAGQSGLDPTWGAGNASGLNNVANAAAAIQAAADLFYKFGSVLSNPSTSQAILDQKAGLQLAVWAALYDTTARPPVEVRPSDPKWPGSIWGLTKQIQICKRDQRQPGWPPPRWQHCSARLHCPLPMSDQVPIGRRNRWARHNCNYIPDTRCRQCPCKGSWTRTRPCRSR